MNKTKRILLDASAVMAVINQEPGYEQTEAVLAHSAIPTVNYSEVISILIRNNIAESIVDEVMDGLIPEIIPFTYDIATLAGKMISQTREHGLSFGDRACIATGIIFKVPVYTADRAWQQLIINGADIRLIR